VDASAAGSEVPRRAVARQRHRDHAARIRGRTHLSRARQALARRPTQPAMDPSSGRQRRRGKCDHCRRATRGHALGRSRPWQNGSASAGSACDNLTHSDESGGKWRNIESIWFNSRATHFSDPSNQS
jgi:hypothetical protein